MKTINKELEENKYYDLLIKLLNGSSKKPIKEHEINRLDKELNMIYSLNKSKIVYFSKLICDEIINNNEAFELVSPLSNLYILFLLNVVKLNPIEVGCHYEFCLNGKELKVDLMVASSFKDKLEKIISNYNLDFKVNIYSNFNLELYKELKSKYGLLNNQDSIYLLHNEFYNQCNKIGYKLPESIKNKTLENIIIMYSIIRDVFNDIKLENVTKFYDKDYLFYYLVYIKKINKETSLNIIEDINKGIFKVDNYKELKLNDIDIKLITNIRYLISRGPSIERIYYSLKLIKYKYKDPIGYMKLSSQLENIKYNKNK